MQLPKFTLGVGGVFKCLAVICIPGSFYSEYSKTNRCNRVRGAFVCAFDFVYHFIGSCKNGCFFRNYWCCRKILGKYNRFLCDAKCSSFFIEKLFLKFSQFIIANSTEIQGTIAKYTQSFVAKGYSTEKANSLAMKKILSSISKQSTLLTNMEIYTAVGYGSLILIVFICFNQHLKQSFNLFKV